MRKNEVMVKIVDTLHIEFGDTIDINKTRNIIEGILYDYNVEDAETSLVTLDDIPDKVLLYLACRKVDGLSDASIKQYGISLMKFSNAVRKNVADINAMDIRIYLANYAKTGVKTNTIVTMTDILRGFFNWLFIEEYVSKNPMNKIKTIKKEIRDKEPLTPMEVEILRKGYASLRDVAIVEFGLSTGLRVSELANVDISDLKFNNHSLQVIGKGNKQRTVYFGAKAELAINEYLNSRDDDCEALFITERKPYTKMSVSSVQRALKLIAKRSEIKKNVHFHLLRHSCATEMLRRGSKITNIQRILGHATLNMTQHYAKTAQSDVEYEYNKFMVN